ncbi:MAG TPA: hypothetical protein DEA08_35265, partial [Planctomycetes bacterium]|nr:hypothetical protein [Planctomycetota bacterium]
MTVSLLRYPVDAGPGTEVSSAAADALHAHVEREHPSGYYPLGANTTWHGGVHLHAAAGAQVVACAPGRVVAARLAAEGCAYGSTNFVLCRHEVHGAVLDELAPARSFEPRPYAFFSLVMHLGSLPLDDPAAPALRPFAWLPRPWSGFRVKSDLNFRAGPGQDVIGVLKPGDRVVLEQEAPVPGGSLPHYRVRGLPDCQSAACRDAVGTVAFKDEWLERIEVDQDALAELRGGGVVALDAEVAAGDPLWTVGEYGGSEQREGLIHWEIFSAENLLPGWESAEDPDLDFNMDCAQIAALVDQRALVGRDNLDPGEIRDFYARDPDARRMRTLAAKFVSEWGVDVDAAVPRMKGLPALRNFFLGDLADKIRPLMWWDEASAAGVELPADKRVWHYHPVSFLSALEPVWSLEGQSIIIAGQRFPIGAPVKTWLDEGGFDGYTERRVFSEGVVASHPCNEHCHRARRYDTRAAFAGKEEVSYQDVADHVDLFVIHYDACWFSQLCFKVLHDERGLSCHFLLDV